MGEPGTKRFGEYVPPVITQVQSSSAKSSWQAKLIADSDLDVFFEGPCSSCKSEGRTVSAEGPQSMQKATADHDTVSKHGMVQSKTSPMRRELFAKVVDYAAVRKAHRAGTVSRVSKSDRLLDA